MIKRNKNLNYICASRLDTDPAELTKNIDNLASFIYEKLHDRTVTIRQKHNAFTSYCIKLLAYSTGHRPVTDMFAFREDIDLEEDIIVINDKISSSATENRVCWFSKLANEQIKAYFRHLTSLAKFLHTEKSRPEVASIIYGLIDPIAEYKQSIPLFFFLDSDFNFIPVTPSLLLEEINSVWPYIEDNHNRHCLESCLDHIGIASSLIDLQTGHQRNHNHLLGITTSWTASECASILKPALDQVAEIQGWRVLNGLKYEADTQIKKCHPKPEREFGHIRRRSIRKENLITLENKIKDIVLGEVAKNGGTEPYLLNIQSQEESIETILSECMETEKLSHNAIEIFISLINEMAKDHGVRKIKSLNLLPVESTPFDDGWLLKYVTARKIRQNFLQFLKLNTNQKKHNFEHDWAIIVISAVLFSGLFKYEWIAYILEASPSSLRKIKKWLYYIDIWIDKPDSDLNIEYQSPNWRWYPDPLSRNLILRFLQKHKKTTKPKIKIDNVNQAITNILKEIGPHQNKRFNSLRDLCNLLESYWLYHFPSYIRSVFQSQLETRPLPERTLARLCYQKRLSIDLPNRDKKIYIDKYKNAAKPNRNLKEYLTVIKSCINTAKSKNKTSKSKQLSDLKIRIVRAYKDSVYPDIAMILGQWLLHMIEYGGARGTPLDLKTIDNYYFSVAKPLSIYIGYNKLEEYDEEVISDIYSKVVNYNNADQSTRAHQLFRFNLICSEYGLIDFNELNWGAIAGKWLSYQETRIDSNIVTPEEYYQSLALIDKSKLDKYTKSWASIFLILGYRFGLRIGEAHHLRWEDIQWLDEDVIIQVQRTIQGRKKTPAAIRQVPLMGTFSDMEHEIFDYHLKQIKKSPGFTIKTFIFHSPDNTNELLPRHIIWSVVHSVLRAITGDMRIRFHHLRHSFSTGQFLSNLKQSGYLVQSESNNSLWSSYEECINNNLINPKKSQAYLMSAFSTSIGHTRFSTTLHSYIHLADDIASGYARKAPFPDVSVSELSEITGYKESTLKSRIRTKRINKHKINGMDVLATIQIGDEIPAYNFKLEKFPKKLKYDNKKKELKISDIYDILISTAIEHCPPEVIAYMKCIEDESVKDIINTARQVEKNTKYNDFGFSKEISENWFPLPPVKGKKSIYNEKTNIKNLFLNLNSILTSSSNKKILFTATKNWVDSQRIQSSGNALIFTRAKQLSDFLTACCLLGYKSTHFNFSYSRNLSEENKKHLLKNLDRIGIINAKSEKIRRLENGVNEQRHNFVKSTLNRFVPDNLPKKLASLNQVFFMLLIYFEKK